MQINIDVVRDEYPAVGAYVEWNFHRQTWADIMLYFGMNCIRINITRGRT